jgi:hypothetical protein
MTLSNILKCSAIAAAVLFAGAPASATTCRDGERFCSDSISTDVWKLGWHVRAGGGATRPARFVCDINGLKCHYTRRYLLDDDGNFRFDPTIPADGDSNQP